MIALGKVYNTTDYTDVSPYLKSKLSKNFVGDNYWIESFQNKMDKVWDYATNVVDIEESQEVFFFFFVKAKLKYKLIEVRITSAFV